MLNWQKNGYSTKCVFEMSNNLEIVRVAAWEFTAGSF